MSLARERSSRPVSPAAPLRVDAEPLEVAPLPSVEGGYRTVLADPPWRFTNRTGKVAPEHRRLDRYDTMTLPEIRALPVADVVADRLNKVEGVRSTETHIAFRTHSRHDLETAFSLGLD